MAGPLAGLKVVELAGIGPGPFGGMLLADMGADVVRIDRTGASGLGVELPARLELLNRNKRSIALDLKRAEDLAVARSLIDRADALIEGFRPGVAERLGLGPEACWRSNPRLVYGRVTGWGQDGPLAQAAGHDLNYIALTGALHAIGPGDGVPSPPLSLVGDFGGGGIYLAFGVMCALHEARASGRGQVVDAAMIDGAASLMTAFYALRAAGRWSAVRGTNIVDGGAYFYGVYRTADDRFVSVAPIEGKFHAQLCERLGLDPSALPPQDDRARWPEGRATLERLFRSRTRDEWCALLEGTDACFAPVLEMDEVASHPHHVARATFAEADGVVQPAPAPRMSRTPGALRRPPPEPGEHSDDILADWGVAPAARSTDR